MAEWQANYTEKMYGLEARNAMWQAEFQAALMGGEAGMAREQAELTFAQAEQMEGSAITQREISEKDIALNESKAFDTLAENVSTKKTQMGKSGVRVNVGSSASFLADYWNKKSTEISTGADILRQGAELEKSNTLFSAAMTRAKGTIQLDEASLMDTQANYLLAMGDYSANMIRYRGERETALSRAQAAIYRAGSGQALTAGWLNAAGTGTSAGYNILNKP